MAELSDKTRDALMRIGTSTLTGALNRRGLRSMYMQDVWPIKDGIPRMVGLAFTMRFIPSREDKDGPNAKGPARRTSSRRRWRRARRVMCWWLIRAAIRGPRRRAIFMSGG